jgi:hypothetical protein
MLLFCVPAPAAWDRCERSEQPVPWDGVPLYVQHVFIPYLYSWHPRFVGPSYPLFVDAPIAQELRAN